MLLCAGVLASSFTSTAGAQALIDVRCPDDMDVVDGESYACAYGPAFRESKIDEMCVFYGATCTNRREPEPTWGQFCKKSMGEPLYWRSNGGNEVVQTAAHCVRGELNGTAQSLAIYELDHTWEGDWNRYEPDILLMATGKFKKDEPTGAHVQRILAVEDRDGEWDESSGIQWTKRSPLRSMVVATACYPKQKFKRDRDGNVNHLARFVDGNWYPYDGGLWLWSVSALPPIEPIKPRFEDFTNLYAPELQLPDKPLRGDYESYADLKDALKDYKDGVRQAKSDYAKELVEYKEERRKRRAAVEGKLEAAMETYRAHMAEYKTLRAEFKRASTIMGKLASQCPNPGDGVCLGAPCDGAARCSWSKETLLSKIASEDFRGLPDLTEGCVVTPASCKVWKGCKASGQCSYQEGACKAVGEADCKQSKLCREDGKCHPNGQGQCSSE